MDLERILEGLMVPDTETIKKATKALKQALTFPVTIAGLFKLMTGHVSPGYRQLAAVILKRVVSTPQDYHQIPWQIRRHMKDFIVCTIFREKEHLVRSSMTQFLKQVLLHENRLRNGWVNESVQYILSQCFSFNAQAMEIGSFVFVKLADVSPGLFLERFNTVGELFKMVLASLENNSRNVSPGVVVNVLTGMGTLVSEILNFKEVKEAYVAAVPHIVNISMIFAAEGLLEQFKASIGILQNMVDYTPILLNQHVRLLMEFAISVGSNTSHPAEMRNEALTLTFCMISAHKKSLMKLKLLEPILDVVFNVMASEPESDDADEFFVQSETASPLSTATVVIDTMATELPAEVFIPLISKLLDRALSNTTNDMHRRTAYIILATIAEGCRDTICDKYLESMLDILQQGMNDPLASVRNAAFFAFGQFSEHLQPEIAEYANQVLPVLFKHMQEIFQNNQIESKYAERVFYALEAFCDNLENNLEPYMEDLMGMVMTILSNDYPLRLKVFAMTLTEATAKAYKGSLLRWLPQLLERLQPMVMLGIRCDDNETRSQAIDTLAAIARNVGRLFLPFANTTLLQGFSWIENTKDADVCKAVLNLFGALASVAGEGLSMVLPRILSHIDRCMTESTCQTLALNCFTTNNEGDTSMQLYGDDATWEIKEQCVLTIRELTESCMKSLLPLAEGLFEAVYKLIDHEPNELRASSIESATTFIINWMKQDSSDPKAAPTLHRLFEKLICLTCKDDQRYIVVNALDAMSDIISDLGRTALPNKEFRDWIAWCVEQGLTYKYMCFFEKEVSGGENEHETEKENKDKIGDDEAVTESDKTVIESAANLLASLGNAAVPEEFAEYFQFLEPYIIKYVEDCIEHEDQLEPGYLICTLGKCYVSLGSNIGPYFNRHYKAMIRASKRRNSTTRLNAIHALGKLMRAADTLAYSYFPEVLQMLSEIFAKEKKRSVIDSIIGALARLILINAALVPLQQIVPAILQKIDDRLESVAVMECFNVLYEKFAESMRTHTEVIMTVAIQSIAKPHRTRKFVKCTAKLLRRINAIYPDDYYRIMSSPAIVSLLSKTREMPPI